MNVLLKLHDAIIQCAFGELARPVAAEINVLQSTTAALAGFISPARRKSPRRTFCALVWCARARECTYPPALLLLQRLSCFLPVCLGLRGYVYRWPAQHEFRAQVQLRAEPCARKAFINPREARQSRLHYGWRAGRTGS